MEASKLSITGKALVAHSVYPNPLRRVAPRHWSRFPGWGWINTVLEGKYIALVASARSRAHPMTVPRPHFLLFCDGSLPNPSESAIRTSRGRWRFVLEDIEGQDRLEASDAESSQAPDRLALLAVVRGLEALQQPSRVTLVTSSRYVTRGLQYGLPEWRENDYCWEHFGTLQPIRNADLWQRIDHAAKYHSIHCRLMSGEGEEEVEPGFAFSSHPRPHDGDPSISSSNVALNEVDIDLSDKALVGVKSLRRGKTAFNAWKKRWALAISRWFSNRYVLATV